MRKLRTIKLLGVKMPIKIVDHLKLDKSGKPLEIAWLLNDNWRLPDQMKVFEAWLVDNKSLPTGNYKADIGFSPRPDAFGGGGKVSLDSMKIMVQLGLELYLSEYPEE
jgi:hypothetical protein